MQASDQVPRQQLHERPNFILNNVKDIKTIQPLSETNTIALRKAQWACSTVQIK